MKYIASLLIVSVFSSCSLQPEKLSVDPNQTKELVLAQQENRKYKLTAIFYGEGSSATDAVIKRIAIRNDTTGGELNYKPQEPFNGNNIWNVWSPDGEVLLLMRGDVKGICIIKTVEAEREINSQSCSDYIMVYEKTTETGLIHTYGVWTNTEEFRFSAGLSGDLWDFSYNIRTHELKVEGSNKNFEGQNRYGKVDLRG
jgi:hypothetical protein